MSGLHQVVLISKIEKIEILGSVLESMNSLIRPKFDMKKIYTRSVQFLASYSSTKAACLQKQIKNMVS